MQMSIQAQLNEHLRKIKSDLNNTMSFEERAILMLAKTNTLAALQKYEKHEHNINLLNSFEKKEG